ncbi:MAG: contractile injection system tape measure protein, partial [Roseiarcus sp.]
MSNHVVHRIRFDLRVGSRPQAARAQEAASRFAAEALPAILDQCLAGLAPDDRVVVFDRLDLEIGAVPERELAEQLPSRFARALADALFAARHARAIGEPAAAHETTLAERRRERLLDFLDFGLFAPPAEASEPGTPAALLDALLESEPDLAGLLAVWWRERPDLRVRLARQFPDATLGRLVGAVSEAGSGAAVAIIDALNRALGDGPDARTSDAARVAAWQRILGAALEGRPAPSLEDLVAGAMRAVAAGPGRGPETVESALRAARVRTGAPAPAEFGAAAAPTRAPGRMPAGQGDTAHALARPRAARET